ncbi:hypothetical protein [Cupriavidus metallidurans]|uniref:hypothetical protein n=1 Tax=Cupriavidus metallidurans TaxID=119219 RepID=UPI00126883D4|nr:hypothetical protein [Cupriavidus metallidurans]
MRNLRTWKQFRKFRNWTNAKGRMWRNPPVDPDTEGRDWTKAPDRQIAGTLGVSQPTVSTVRRELEDAGDVIKVITTTGHAELESTGVVEKFTTITGREHSRRTGTHCGNSAM